MSHDLRKFEDQAEFDAYLQRVRELADEYGYWWALNPPSPPDILLAQNNDEMGCNPEEEDCEIVEEMVTTGSRVAAPAFSITNNQEGGVDEGDIVKLYDRILIVLQHGRLFSVDLGDSSSAIRLVDRIDVYVEPDDDVWYDELLIAKNKLVVTGFNYMDDTTNISVFEISDDGAFSRRSTYFITSDDYYSSSNYATRIVDNQLVIYTPMSLYDYDVEDGVVIPLYRQRLADGTETFWQPLFAVTDIFWPIQETLAPTVHTISVCPIETEDGLQCRSTGIVGPDLREFYVSPEYAYIWNAIDPYELEDSDYWIGDCPEAMPDSGWSPSSAALYRIPLFGGETTAVKTHGIPFDQFSLDAREHSFHALVEWSPEHCWNDDSYHMKYVKIANSEFRRKPRSISPGRYTDLPEAFGWGLQNRFTEKYVAYTSSDDGWWDRDDEDITKVIAVPLASPDRHTTITLEHGVERLEVLGTGLITFGESNRDGLHITTIGLNRRPRVADSEFLPGYYESEGRSHAFNHNVDEHGSGLFGIPITTGEPYRSWIRLRDNSDIGFFSINPAMQMTNAGMLMSSPETEDHDYECEVSCYDWYGNARPIFIGDRVFALSGSELIEGRNANGQITEAARVSLTTEPAYH